MLNAVLLCSPLRTGCSSLGSHAAIRAQRDGPPLRGCVVPLPQFRGKLQQPGQTVGPLEAVTALRVEILYFPIDILGSETAVERATRFLGKRRLREQTYKTRQ
jgi:hypothetical protein